MLVTCYTDASYNEGRGASWSVWIRSDRGRIIRSGRCPPFVQNSTTAELAAVYAGMILVVRSWPEVSLLLIRSDCQTALDLVVGTVRAKEKSARRIQRKISALLVQRRLEVRCRWVKGHQAPSSSKEAFLNHSCDRLARAAQQRPGRVQRSS
jgi:ribonuclease HI